MLMNFNPRSLAGATVLCPRAAIAWADFNPRSLTGATRDFIFGSVNCDISIHAPSRERLAAVMFLASPLLFQSTLPHGSDPTADTFNTIVHISIHAPSRERP